MQQRAESNSRGVALRFKPSQRSYDDLLATVDDLNRDRETWRSQGIALTMWYPEPHLNKVRVEVLSDPASARASLAAKYGDVIDVVAANPEPVTYGASRVNDVSPWNGGDGLKFDSPGTCTSGPAVKSASGQTYLLTAGHCLVSYGTNFTGSYVYRTFNAADSYTSSGTLIGNAAPEWSTSGYDVALVQTTASGLVFRTSGTNDAGTAVAQKTSFGSTGGLSVCVSGVYSGERCGAVVNAVDSSFTDVNGVFHIHAVRATHPTTDVAGEGDSGGAVYTVQSTGLYMTGMFWGFQDYVACSRNALPGRTCGRTMYYTDLNSLMNHRAVSLVIK
jgi:hypothetical protein